MAHVAPPPGRWHPSNSFVLRGEADFNGIGVSFVISQGSETRNFRSRSYITRT